MNKVIYMFWHSKKNHFNFGDDINPFIVESLSAQRVKKVMVFGKNKSILYNLAKLFKGILKGNYSTSILREYTRSLMHPDYIVGIGSILHNNFSKEAKIWGSGIINKDSEVNDSNFHAVRGQKTIERLRDLGYEFEGKVGDPALLLPVIYNPLIKKHYKIGIIPHVIHFETILKKYSSYDEYIIIDLSDKDIKKTIEQIKSCNRIISSSLHGVIVSHAYQVPALHVQLGEDLSGDGIKFIDYYSSVGIKEYKELKIADSELSDFNYFDNLFEMHEQFALPDKDIIDKIQRDLLAVAPFEVSEKYKKV